MIEGLALNRIPLVEEVDRDEKPTWKKGLTCGDIVLGLDRMMSKLQVKAIDLSTST